MPCHNVKTCPVFSLCGSCIMVCSFFSILYNVSFLFCFSFLIVTERLLSFIYVSYVKALIGSLNFGLYLTSINFSSLKYSLIQKMLMLLMYSFMPISSLFTFLCNILSSPLNYCFEMSMYPL